MEKETGSNREPTAPGGEKKQHKKGGREEGKERFHVKKKKNGWEGGTEERKKEKKMNKRGNGKKITNALYPGLEEKDSRGISHDKKGSILSVYAIWTQDFKKRKRYKAFHEEKRGY